MSAGDNRQLGAIEHQDQKVRFLYDRLRIDTIRYLDDYIIKGRGTLGELKLRFHRYFSELTENERKEINTVQKLVETLEDQGVIGANDVEILKMLAEKLELQELKKIAEEFEADCLGKVTKGSTAIHLKTVLSVLGAGLALAGATLVYIYATNPEKLENIFVLFESLVPYPWNLWFKYLHSLEAWLFSS